ncbi:unnamed protein product, partial [Prorocentrum cordatum]
MRGWRGWRFNARRPHPRHLRIRQLVRTLRREQQGPMAAAANGGRIIDFTAGDMCCACGGGEGGNSTAPTPTSPTPAPTPSPNPATCADTSEEAIGTNGGGCEWWTDYAQYCVYDYLYDDSDFTAGDMCCACGGGEGGNSTAPTPTSPTPAPTSSPSPAPTPTSPTPAPTPSSNPAICADTSEEAVGINGGGCEWWTDYPLFCIYSPFYDDADFTAAEMCCACGGGEATA